MIHGAISHVFHFRHDGVGGIIKRVNVLGKAGVTVAFWCVGRETIKKLIIVRKMFANES